jgi:phosphoribosyl 1,2-cyclic phosphate phosphodiesterase
MKDATLRFLGTGSSAGAPIIGCKCAVCTSKDPKNRRLRASVLLELGDKNILVDAGPDIRQQALTHDIKRIDGLVLTHAHFDHVGGLEELRAYNFMQAGPIPCLLSNDCFQSIKKLFYYLFEPSSVKFNYTSQFVFNSLMPDRGSVEFCGITIRYFSYMHSGMKVLGFRFGDVAYVTDIKEYSETIFEELQGLSTLIVSALRFTHSDIQFSIDEAIDFAQKCGAKETYLVHMAHDIEYGHIQTLLPPSIKPAYDGLTIACRI